MNITDLITDHNACTRGERLRRLYQLDASDEAAWNRAAKSLYVLGENGREITLAVDAEYRISRGESCVGGECWL